MRMYVSTHAYIHAFIHTHTYIFSYINTHKDLYLYIFTTKKTTYTLDTNTQAWKAGYAKTAQPHKHTHRHLQPPTNLQYTARTRPHTPQTTK